MQYKRNDQKYSAFKSCFQKQIIGRCYRKYCKISEAFTESIKNDDYQNENGLLQSGHLLESHANSPYVLMTFQQ